MDRCSVFPRRVLPKNWYSGRLPSLDRNPRVPPEGCDALVLLREAGLLFSTWEWAPSLSESTGDFFSLVSAMSGKNNGCCHCGSGGDFPGEVMEIKRRVIWVPGVWKRAMLPSNTAGLGLIIYWLYLSGGANT